MLRRRIQWLLVSALALTLVACGEAAANDDIDAKVEAAVAVAIAEFDIDAKVEAAVAKQMADLSIEDFIALAIAQELAAAVQPATDQSTQSSNTPSPTAAPQPTATPMTNLLVADETFLMDLDTRHRENPLRLEKELEEAASQFKISGTIQSIEASSFLAEYTAAVTVGENLDGYNSFKLGKEGARIELTCYFNQAEVDRLIDLSVGDEITMGGTYEGILTWMGGGVYGLVLKDCQILA